MSEVPQGPGWWRASDGRWYPPAMPVGPPVTTSKRRRRVWPWVLVVGVAVPLGVLVGMASIAAEGEPSDEAARTACARLRALAQDVVTSTMTPPEVVARVTDVRDVAQQSAVPDLAAATNELQAGAILSDAERVEVATRRVLGLCDAMD